MKKSKAIEILKQELVKIPQLRQLAPGNPEFKLWRDKILDVMNLALDESDRNRFSLAVPLRVDWSWASGKKSDQGRAQYDEDLTKYETALKSIIQKYEILGETVSTSEVSREAIYPSDTPYNAYKHIKSIITSATKKLIVVDPYVDDTVMVLLEEVQHDVEIQVLTRNMKGDFQLVAQKFRQERQKAGRGSFEVHKDKGDFHDRFIVADGKFFQVGASIKDAGLKVFAVNEIEESGNKSVLMEIISKSWDAAEKVL